MKELTLREVKGSELELLKAFDAFCNKNGIRYFLSNGTLLGAVKYRGFIPWDDDIDVLVPRTDYNRLISLFEDDTRHTLFSPERVPAFRYPFAKLCDMTTRKEEGNIDNGVSLGVDIDIFPLDAWRVPLKRAKREEKRIHRRMAFLWLTKLKKPDSHNPVKRVVKGLFMGFLKLFGSRYFIRLINKACLADPKQDSSYLGCKAWPIYGEREILPANVFRDIVEVEFEGLYLPAPGGYDTYLRSLYGNYEKDPPAELQKSHHSFKAYTI